MKEPRPMTKDEYIEYLKQGLDDEVNKHRRNNVEQLEEIRQLMQENEGLKQTKERYALKLGKRTKELWDLKDKIREMDNLCPIDDKAKEYTILGDIVRRIEKQIKTLKAMIGG